MRIISQDGMMDFPYELCAVYISKNPDSISKLKPNNYLVLCRWQADQKSANVLAEYQSEDNAKKAMQMLHDAYNSQDVEYENGIYRYEILFRFPSNKELEDKKNETMGKMEEQGNKEETQSGKCGVKGAACKTSSSSSCGGEGCDRRETGNDLRAEHTGGSDKEGGCEGNERLSESVHRMGCERSIGQENLVRNADGGSQERRLNMTKEEFASGLNNREYGSELTQYERQRAKESGLVVVYGASDDLIEFDGTIRDEGGCFDGGDVYFDRTGVAQNGEKLANRITAVWCGKVDDEPVGDLSEFQTENGETITWTYKTDIPHATFMVYEDGEPYCRGIIFSIEDIK